MSNDSTQQQNLGQQQRACQLSLHSTQPPGQAPGYEIQRRLGDGAYGEVWLATDRTTGRQVAIKFYLHRGGLDWTLLAREVEKLAFLSADRYVVQLLDVGWDAEPPFYVMEYMEHGSLDEVLNQRGALPPAEAVALFREVVIGLTHTHGKGVLHCDLKPANILLDQDQRPRLADFGQSRLSYEQTPALGTLFYMAPEQADLNAVPDARWDVYALGAILHCLLTGQPPHRHDDAVRYVDQGKDLVERLACYRDLLAASPRSGEHRYVPGVDRALAELVDRCLAIDPAERYANAQAVLGALEARERTRRRRPLLILGAIGPVLLLLVMTFFSWRAFAAAVGRSEQMVRDQAHRTNQFAAKFIAKSVQAELADYFTLLEQEADSPELLADFQAAAASDMLRQINDAATSDGRLGELRARLLNEPGRIQLQTWLDGRLRELMHAGGPPVSKLASIFATDAMGTWLAGAYAAEVPAVPIGENFGWRTYFRGDHPRAEVDPAGAPPHIAATHLSAAFKSSATGTWKIAVSTPVYDRSPDRPRFLGILAITFDIGDFAIFRSREASADYFAVLIDNRPGDRQGAILQHPLFQDQPPAQDFRVPPAQLARLRSEPVYDFRDPLATAAGGQEYQGEWIAATEPVALPRRNQQASRPRHDTDLLVLVQINAATAMAPVQQLGRRLARDALVALGVVVAVVIALWAIVYRISHERSDPWPQKLRVPLDPTPPHNLPTLAAVPRRGVDLDRT